MSLSPLSAIDSAIKPTATSAVEPAARMPFERERLLVWGRLSALSLVDQSLASSAGFVVNLLLARWMAPEVYGAFAVAFAGFLFVSGFHNVLLLEPTSVMGPSRYLGSLPAYFRSQIAVHGILVGALSGVLFVAGLILWKKAPGIHLTGAVLGGGLALPFLLLAWLARRMCYVMRRPGLAIQGSAFYLGSVVAGLFVLAYLGLLNPFSAFVLMGFGGLVSAGLLVLRLGLFEGNSAGGTRFRWFPILQENWKYGRWLIGSALLNPAVSQGQVFFIAAFLGLGAAGVLRAMQLPSLLITQAITATGLLFLPVLSGAYGRGAIADMRHKAMLLSVALAGISLCFAACLAIFSSRLEQVLFGGKYAASAGLMPILALVPVVSAISIGYSMALRASQKPQFDLLANLVAAPVALLSAFFFIGRWGLGGAASSMLLGFLTLGAVTIVWFLKGK